MSMSGMSRREFLTYAGVAAAGMGLAGTALGRVRGLAGLAFNQPAERSFFEWREVAPGVLVAIGQGGNSMLLVDGGLSLLVDCKNPVYGQVLRRESLSRGKIIAMVVSTHHHVDHTGGNHAFTKDITVVGHTQCKKRVLEQFDRYAGAIKAAAVEMDKLDDVQLGMVGADAKRMGERLSQQIIKPQEFAPTLTIDDAREEKIGSQPVQMKHVGPAHTDNDVFVFLPKKNVLHTGDLLFYRNHPFIDLPAGATTTGWQQAVKQLAEMCDDKTVVIPGHGEPTDKKGLLTQVEYFDKMRAHVEKMIKDGKDRTAIVKSEAPEEFKSYGLTQILPITLGGIYDELKK